MKSFVHLHTHSDFSLWRSTARVKDLVQTASSAGMSALALTDDYNLFAAPAFSKACEIGSTEVQGNQKEMTLKPIIGVDLGLVEAGHPLSIPSSIEETEGFLADRKFWFRPVLLVQDDTGYANLCSLLSAMNGIGGARWNECPNRFLADRSKGLVALSGGRNGELSNHLAMGAWSEARECAGLYQDIFGKDRYWLELIPRGFRDWRRINTALLRLAWELGIGVVASNDVRFTRRSDRRAFEIFVQAGVESGHSVRRPVFTGREAWLKSNLEMDRMFGHVSGALENSLRIAEMIEFRLQDRKPTLPFFGTSTDGTNQHLGKLAREGLERRYGQKPPEEAESRLAMELAMVELIEIAPWFLATKEHVDLARAAGIGIGPGRGSLPGSLVAYCLSITDLDPLLYGLLPFQFFASAARNRPSFDLDFEYGRRNELLELVAARWGRDRVAFIPTFGTIRPMEALRIAGKGLCYPEFLVSAATRLVPERHFSGPFLQAVISTEDGAENRDGISQFEAKLHEASLLLAAFLRRGGRRRKLLETAAILEKRHTTVNLHAAGCVVAGEAIEGLVPLFRDRNTGEQAVQCPLEQLEGKGLSKFDFLGLRTLDEISSIVRCVEADHPEFELASIPPDDELVWRRISEGDTDDIFCIASEGFRAILGDCRPTSLVELAVLNALYRPGMMSMIPIFRARKLEGEAYSLPHAALEPILRESQGLAVFNEQITLAIAALTGCEGAEAERQRAQLASRRTNEYEFTGLRDNFIRAMVDRQACSREEALGTFDFLRLGASRCFLKSHSLAYCLIAYRQLWLRVHFPQFALESTATYTTNEGA